MSEPNWNQSLLNEAIVTPPNYVFGRAKKRKEQDSPADLEHSTPSCSLRDFHAFKEEKRDMFAFLLAAQQQEFKKINPTLHQIQETNAKIETSIEHLYKENAELKKEIEKLKKQKKEDTKYITTLEDRIETIQKGFRKANFEIKNVPRIEKKTKDDLTKLATCLSTTVGANITKSDIKDIYRVRGKMEMSLTQQLL